MLQKMNLYLIDIKKKSKNSNHVRNRKHISEVIFRKILSIELGIPFQKIKIFKNNYGKPFIENEVRHFNVSFSNDFYIVVTDDAPIGIDIEFVKKISDVNDLISCFSSEERTYLSGLKNSKKIDYFYRLWVLKESYIKAIGKGLSCPLNSFYIKSNGMSASLVYAAEKDLVWKFKSYSFPEGYKLAICAKHDRFSENPVVLQLNELLNI